MHIEVGLSHVARIWKAKKKKAQLRQRVSSIVWNRFASPSILPRRVMQNQVDDNG